MPVYPIYRNGEHIDNVRIKEVQKAVNDGTAEERFKLGDQIVVPWTNPTDNKQYDCPFVFSTFQNFTDDTGTSKYGIGFMSLYGLPTAYQFDGKEPSNTDTNRRSYGNNRWAVSNIRQWLNSTGSNWYVAQHEYDSAPTGTYKSFVGYMDTLPIDLVSFATPVLNNTQAANVDNNIIETSVDRFYLLSLNQINISGNSQAAYRGGYAATDGIEGEPWQYYSNPYNNTLITTYATNGTHTKYDITSTNTIVKYWLRSAYFTLSNHVWYFYTNNSLEHNSASQNSSIVPAFSILSV